MATAAATNNTTSFSWNPFASDNVLSTAGSFRDKFGSSLFENDIRKKYTQEDIDATLATGERLRLKFKEDAIESPKEDADLGTIGRGRNFTSAKVGDAPVSGNSLRFMAPIRG